MYKPLALFTLLALTAWPSVAQDYARIEIREWAVPWESSRPRDPFVENHDSIWFVGQRSHYIARFEPSSEKFTKIDLGSGVGPHNLIVDDQGDVWYAGNLASHIGRVNPKSGDIRKIMMPNSAARDPHTLTFDSKGDIWFTVQLGNFVGKLTRENAQVSLITVPTPRARPYGVVVNANDQPWFVLFGTNKLATVEPGTQTLREIILPREKARPRRLGETSDGRIWYVDYAEGFLGRYDPVRQEFKEWQMPAGKTSKPYAMAIDNQDRIWVVETGPTPNRFVGFDTKNNSFFSVTEIASGGGAVRHMHYHAPTNAIWFGTDTNTIGRAVLP